jgi:hypothetical protein
VLLLQPQRALIKRLAQLGASFKLVGQPWKDCGQTSSTAARSMSGFTSSTSSRLLLHQPCCVGKARGVAPGLTAMATTAAVAPVHDPGTAASNQAAAQLPMMVRCPTPGWTTTCWHPRLDCRAPAVPAALSRDRPAVRFHGQALSFARVMAFRGPYAA